MDEVLLSRPLLKSIGFDLEKHLSSVQKTFHDTDFSHIGFSADMERDSIDLNYPSPLTGALINASEQLGNAVPIDREPEDEEAPRGVSTHLLHEKPKYQDHIEPEESENLLDCTIDVGQNQPNETSVLSTMLLEEALENGFPSEMKNQLSALLQEFKDLFRTKMAVSSRRTRQASGPVLLTSFPRMDPRASVSLSTCALSTCKPSHMFDPCRTSTPLLPTLLSPSATPSWTSAMVTGNFRSILILANARASSLQ
eukprot:IDg8400t1